MMSAEQLSTFLEAVKADAVLAEKLKAAADLDAAVAMAKDAGFDVSQADWLKAQAKQVLEMSDKELAVVAGGRIGLTVGEALPAAWTVASPNNWGGVMLLSDRPGVCMAVARSAPIRPTRQPLPPQELQ